MPSLAPLRQLNDGHNIPIMCLGVYRVPPGNATYTTVRMAISNGYRCIDTAQAYLNEKSVGDAVRESGTPREELFITTKLSSVWMSHHITYNRTLVLLRASLRKLGMSYIDLYLIHSPRDATHRLEQWRALTHAKNIGLVRSISCTGRQTKSPPGVCHFQMFHTCWMSFPRSRPRRCSR